MAWWSMQGLRVGVPSFLGEPLRVAVESATSAGLALQIVGSGIAREQVPAPGIMVPPGTEIVVRFTRCEADSLPVDCICC